MLENIRVEGRGVSKARFVPFRENKFLIAANFSSLAISKRKEGGPVVNQTTEDA